MALVSKLSSGLRRVLIGQPFRSDKLAHTLLPKRIALPVFASDAMSSVAYAPEEIFLVLSVAGLSAYAMAAAKARSMFASALARRRINRVTGTVLAFAAVVIALR